MKCEVYKSNRKDGAYIFVAESKALESLPDALKTRLGRLEWVMELDLAGREALAATDPATVIDSIESRGFYLQLPSGDEAYSC